MLTANCCVSLGSGWGTSAQLEVYAVLRCVVCNGYFYLMFSDHQLVLVGPGFLGMIVNCPHRVLALMTFGF